ncbi:MAG: hypothetical protein CL910_10155 [Deltaproteobacteria bacterium]|nr:hypothetical protein [Deltaproteobacteria bacterium]
MIRHLLPERARLLAAEGAALRVEARPRGGGPARRGDILGIALGAPLPAAPAWIVVGDDDAAWALAARLARTEHGPVAITTADGAAWPAPRTATREHRDWRNGGGW